MHHRTACVSKNRLGQTVQTGQQTLGHLELFSDYVRRQTESLHIEKGASVPKSVEDY